MNTHDEQFFKALDARIAQARKEHGTAMLQQASSSQQREPGDLLNGGDPF
jgi:hypothetical protein